MSDIHEIAKRRIVDAIEGIDDEQLNLWSNEFTKAMEKYTGEHKVPLVAMLDNISFLLYVIVAAPGGRERREEIFAMIEVMLDARLEHMQKGTVQ